MKFFRNSIHSISDWQCHIFFLLSSSQNIIKNDFCLKQLLITVNFGPSLLRNLLTELFETLHYRCICKTSTFDRLLGICKLFAWESSKQCEGLCCILRPCTINQNKNEKFQVCYLCSGYNKIKYFNYFITYWRRSSTV